MASDARSTIDSKRNPEAEKTGAKAATTRRIELESKAGQFTLAAIVLPLYTYFFHNAAPLA